MTNMLATIVPKSDQLNADDLIGRDLTITITDVFISAGTEQPVSLRFEGDGGKPWKPCKSMRRVLVQIWGADAKAYKGRSATLVRDPSVTWAGQAVGGIRISHMSDLKEQVTLALTATKKTRAPFVVKPIVSEKSTSGPKRTVAQFLEELEADLRACDDKETVAARLAQPDVANMLGYLKNGMLTRLQAVMLEHRERVGLTLDDPDHPAEMQT